MACAPGRGGTWSRTATRDLLPFACHLKASLFASWTTKGGGQEATLAALSRGAREDADSVARRCRSVVQLLRELPESSIAIVSHCMVLQQLQTEVENCDEGAPGPPPTFLDNTEIRTIVLE
eukprot:SAG22_NODE_1230_length_5074_cov_3.372864_3_plen_121_part_00